MTENKIEGVMSIPPAAVAGLSLVGVSLQDWVLLATLAWLTMQIGWFGYCRFRDWKKK